MQSEQLPFQGMFAHHCYFSIKLHTHTCTHTHTHIHRLKSSFIVSGSQDCTMKMWKVGRSLVEGEKDVDDRDLDVSRLKVKYTHLAHDKVCQSVSQSGREINTGL